MSETNQVRRRVMPHAAERQSWILAWLKDNFCADAVNAQFHDDYAEKFPMYKRRYTNWGAQPVAQAMRDLRTLAKCGMVDAGRIGLPSGNWEPGFPKWVIGYTLPQGA